MKKFIGKSIGFFLIGVILLMALFNAAFEKFKANAKSAIIYWQKYPEHGGSEKAGEKIGVPKFQGIKESMISYVMGVAGGLVYGIIASIFGSSLIGGLAGAGIAGATIKGVRGEIIATVLGFQAILGTLQGAGASTSNQNQSKII